jgi:hypothetical protein
MLQTEPRHAAARRLIDQLLHIIVGMSPGASRADLHIIDARMIEPYAWVRAIAASGHVVTGPRPRAWTDWNGAMPSSRAGRASIRRLADLPATAMRGYWQALGLSTVMVCPAFESETRRGATFVLWDQTNPPPNGRARRDLLQAATRRSKEIAMVLDLCAPIPASMPTG